MPEERRVLAVGDEPPLFTHETAPDKARRKTTRDRFRVLNDFVDFEMFALSRTEMAAWLVLYRDTRDGTARTSMADMARRAGCSRRNMVRALKRLEWLGLVDVVHRGGFRRGSSRYRVHAHPRERVCEQNATKCW